MRTWVERQRFKGQPYSEGRVEWPIQEKPLEQWHRSCFPVLVSFSHFRTRFQAFGIRLGLQIALEGIRSSELIELERDEKSPVKKKSHSELGQAFGIRLVLQIALEGRVLGSHLDHQSSWNWNAMKSLNKKKTSGPHSELGSRRSEYDSYFRLPLKAGYLVHALIIRVDGSKMFFFL